jgi:hypothetical protein
MSYELRFEQEPTYLHVVVTGTNSKQTVAAYLEDIRRECITRNCFRVLIEERLEGARLGVMDVFEIAAEGSRRAPAQFKAFAYVDVNAGGDLMKFAETVAVNRGLPVMVFRTVVEAREWLLRQDAASAEAACVADDSSSR